MSGRVAPMVKVAGSMINEAVHSRQTIGGL
jgi:hypothetical protein